MAKLYREIQFDYGATSESIDVLTDRENVSRIDSSFSRRSLDLTEYKQFSTTNTKRVFTYAFGKCDSDVFDFFNDAWEAHLAGTTVEMTRELDDGSTETLEINIDQPQWQDDTVTDTSDKVYLNVRIRISEV